MAATRKRKTVNYLNNKDLLAEVIKSKEQDEMTDELVKMLMTLVERYINKGNFVNYTYKEDMQAYAISQIVKTWRGFNPERGSNPFAFYTQCIKNSFRQFLKYEKKHRTIRDVLLVKEGLTPSYNYQLEDAARLHEERELIEEEHQPEHLDSSQWYD